MSDKNDATSTIAEKGKMCFIVMPISDPDGYAKGHFKHVYQDIVQPACQQAGFIPLRADDVKQSNLIHLDILQKLLEAPMAVCDLSNRNPNVLFELALRQAFDKPVALIQEVGTPQIFDISPLRYSEYRKERIYHEVLEDQRSIATAIAETFKSHGTGRSINSIVKLLALSKPAALPAIGSPEAKADLQQIILAELSQLRNEFRSIRNDYPYAVRGSLHGDLNPEVNRLKDIMKDAEILLLQGGPRDIVQDLINECRNHYERCMKFAGERGMNLCELGLFMEIDKRIDKLEMKLHKMRGVNATKKK